MSKKNEEHRLFSIDKKDKNNLKDNIVSILIYSMSLATALGFNDLVLNIFDSFKWTGHILAKTTYVVIMFITTIGLAYYMNSTIKH